MNAPTYAAKYVDNGVNTVGSVTFSPSSTTTSMTPASDGGISYGPPISNGSAISSNSSDRNLPAIAMLCQKLSAFPGTNGDKSTDVLVAASATRLLQASDLAGKSLNFYREDCVRGGTFPASANGSAVFDANGNLTFTDSNTTTVYSAATVTSALNGQPAPYSGNGFAVLFGYKYARQDGSIAYGLVAHLAPQQTGLTKGVVSTFTEQ